MAPLLLLSLIYVLVLSLCCFTAALLLLYCCFAADLLLRYCCFTAEYPGARHAACVSKAAVS
jgi:hypothetical protein